jgi:type IV secretion system protein VirB5
MDGPLYLPAGDNVSGFTGDSKGLIISDTVNGLAQKNARMWQIIALVSLSSFFVALGVLVYAVNLPKTVPVIVTVNPEGQAAYVGRVDKSLYGNESIPEIAKEYLIKRLITLMHTWVIDRTAQQMYIDESIAVVQSGAIRQLDLFYRTNNPFARFGERTRTVTIEPPLRQTEKTYIVYFTTNEKDRNGYTAHTARWSALINIDLFEPAVQNPLGLYVTNFDIKQLEAQK